MPPADAEVEHDTETWFLPVQTHWPPGQVHVVLSNYLICNFMVNDLEASV